MRRTRLKENETVTDRAVKESKTDSAKPKSRRRRRSRKQDGSSGEAEVELRLANGETQTLSGHIVDLTEQGVGIETPSPLSVGALVTISSQFFSNEASARTERQARVIHCRLQESGLYRNGFAFEERPEKESGEPATAVAMNGSLPDYYEILQVSSSADTEMVQRVFRLLAQRYHPDNAESGNDEVFRSILQAYQVLSDPEKKAAYDVRYRAAKSERLKLFEQGEPTDYAREKELRGAILTELYEARKKQPEKPSVSLKEMEASLGCSLGRLEFNLWYLRGKEQVLPDDGGRYVITPEGVDVAERNGRPQPRGREQPLLEEARTASA